MEYISPWCCLYLQDKELNSHCSSRVEVLHGVEAVIVLSELFFVLLCALPVIFLSIFVIVSNTWDKNFPLDK